MRHWLVLILLLLGLGTLRVVGCGDESCVKDADCNDGNPCTEDWCPGPPPNWDLSLGCDGDERTCRHSWKDDGTRCGSGKACVGGVCVEDPCEGACNDGNECTEDICDPVTLSCEHTPVADRARCGLQVGDSLGVCVDGDCHVLDCTGVEDGTKCVLSWTILPGLCQAGSCERI